MDHRLAHLATAATAAVLLLPAPALAHGGDTAPSESAAPHATHDMTGHDMTEMDTGTTPGPDDHGATHDHGATGHDDADTHDPGHEQAPDDVSPAMRRLVLTGFASVNGAVIVGAFLIRRTSPARTRRSPR